MMITEHLAGFVFETASLPEDVQRSAVKCVFDLMTATIAGYRTANANAVRRAAMDIWGAGPASIWFAGERTTPHGAAFVNAACASSLDLDDGHRAAAGHPGTAVIPGVFATALADRSIDARRVLVAIALGYEVGVRISASRDLKNIPTTNTGIWCGQAVAAAVAGLRGLRPSQIAHAIAIAGMTSPSQSATPYTKLRGNNVKEGIPWGAANGVLAATLADADFSGPIDILDNGEQFDPAPLLDGLGRDWRIASTYFKPYSCCRWLHAPIDALMAIMAEENIGASDIVGIEVETFARTLTLDNEFAPSSLEGGQYSLPFCLGVAASCGPAALLPLTAEALTDASALEISRRVRMSVTPEMDAMFPAAVPGRVRVTTGSGVFERTVLAPKGEPANPMTWDDIDAKFLAVAHERVAPSIARQIRDAIGALQTGDIAPLRLALDARAFPD
jgi:2-methylcitrate dehydratase PrpD